MKRLSLLVMPLMAISLLACNKGGGGDKPPVGTFYNVKFNITDCSVTYEGDLVGGDGVDIEVPEGTDPYYVKFKVTSNTYKKPSSVMLDKVADYTFDS